MSAPETTVDAFLGGKLLIEQPKSGYRAGIDAVFLAASLTPSHAGATVLDMGAGVGTVGLCAASRCPGIQVTLLERAPELAALARANIARNANELLCGHTPPRVAVVEAALDGSAAALTAAGLGPDSIDHLLANPPYHDDRRGTSAPHALKAASHAMDATGLETWVRVMARLVKPGGAATMIHTAAALPAILAAFAGRFGAVRVLPLHPRAGEPASRIIVAGTKGSRAPLVLLPGFTLHGDGNTFTRAAQSVLRDGAGAPLLTPNEFNRP